MAKSLTLLFKMIDLTTYNTNNYDPGPIFRRAAWYVISRIFFETCFPWPKVLKRILLLLFGCQFSYDLVIKPRVRIKYPWMLTIGSNCWIGEDVWIDNLCDVTLGDPATFKRKREFIHEPDD